MTVNKAASITVIVSDLHLCDAEPENPKRQLWKKFKQHQFFFDSEFADFLKALKTELGETEKELILNGDIFDFDSFMKLPEAPPYKVSWIERSRGLYPQEHKSVFKIREILSEHHIWVAAIREFILEGNRVVFIPGNHDLELHFLAVQSEIRQALALPDDVQNRLTFTNWFYVSNGDTLIEHGNQYDPYCLCQDPINPFVEKANYVEVRLPFGNLAGRYMTNAMGFFNPHVDTAFIMSAPEYLKFFFKYMLRTQPFILLTWFFGALLTFYESFLDYLRPERKDPLHNEKLVEDIAQRSNTSPRAVRELKGLSAVPAATSPVAMARELWLDRAFLVLIFFAVVFQVFSFIKLVYSISFFWMFLPMSIYIPFFIFYARSVDSAVTKYKEPNERVMSLSSQIAGVKRVIYGHTHVARHEMIGAVEHLNSGSWSPAFWDVECTKPFGKKTLIVLRPGAGDQREAQLCEYKNHKFVELFGKHGRHSSSDVARRAGA